MPGYHQLTTEIIERLEQTNPASGVPSFATFAQACLLAEPTAVNLPGIERMVNRYLELEPDSSLPKLAKALLEYRTGDPQAAIDWAQKCPKSDRRVTGILALANAELGEFELAREQIAEMTAEREHPFHAIIRQNDEAHEAAFVDILLAEVKRKLVPE